MIKAKDYNLLYDTAHLTLPKPKTYKQVIERLEKLDCKLFYNIISSPDCRYEKKFAKGRIKESYREMSAEERFKNIFKEKVLYANPKSFFVNKMNRSPSECDNIKSVSFTLCDYKDLKKHFAARGSEYGLCFNHDFLQNNGIRPVTYLNLNKPKENKSHVFNSPHLLEVFNNKYDMQWEEEWRIGENLPFTENDIAFVIVPKDKFEYYHDWFEDNEDFSGISIISSTVYKNLVDHLIEIPQLPDNSWRQVEIFRGRNGGRGLHLDCKHFNDMSLIYKSEFESNHIKELECLAKNTILSKYELKFTEKYLAFAKSLSNIEDMHELFNEHENIELNYNEPNDAERDMVLALWGDLYPYYLREFPDDIL